MNRHSFVISLVLAAALQSAGTRAEAQPTMLDPVVTQVAVGGGSTCALTTSGGVKCWGDNVGGVLGDGTTTQRLTPVDVSGLSSGVVSLSAGTAHACALTTAGAVKCWGWNGAGQLGDGTTTDRSVPTDVSGLSSGVAAISARGRRTCAVTTQGGVKCWGWNAVGQVGDGTTTTRLTPVDVLGLTSGVTSVSAGQDHTCALTNANGLKCWGSNVYGQLGDTTTTNRLTATSVAGLSGGVASLSTGGHHTCAVLVGGAVKCWGYNGYGQIGDGNSAFSQPNPTSVSGLSSGVVKVAGGTFYNCALTTEGAVKCWGSNAYRTLADGTNVNRATPVDALGLSSGVASIEANESHSCVLLKDGSLKCWGHNLFGQLGRGVASAAQSTPAAVAGFSGRPVALSVHEGNGCAITAGGGAKCWGRNNLGQIGDNTSATRLVPTDVSGLTNRVSRIAIGRYHTCAVTAAGGVKCWGYGANGQVGDGVPSMRFTPVDVTGLTSGVANVVAGYVHTCALTTAGGVKCWGENSAGSLGNGTTTSSFTPVSVTGLSSGVVGLSAHGAHTCALTATGGVKCWGYNQAGQLGDGSTTSRATPVDVSGLTSGVSAIAAGGEHTCALLATGGIKCWGANVEGELGNGSTSISQTTPVDVSGLADALQVAAGDFHTCAITATGAAKCWGYNGSGGLGDGTTASSSLPVDVAGLESGVAGLALGNGHSCALKDSGALLCWGVNGDGTLADGTTVERHTPAQVHAGQMITFAAPPGLSLNVAVQLTATSTSGLPVTFDTWTPDTCVVNGDIVTPVAPALCGLRASQAGDSSYAPAPQSLWLSQVVDGGVPDAPTIGVATPGEGAAVVTFTPPANDGGAPVTSYTATCALASQAGFSSPIMVGGLPNEVPVTCHVVATNILGDSAASAESNSVTPSESTNRSLILNLDGNNGAAGEIRAGSNSCTNAPGGSQACTFRYAVGAVVNLTADVSGQSGFGGWTGACASQATSPTCTVTITDDTIVGAAFVGPLTLTLNVGSVESGQGMIYGSTSGPFGYGSFNCDGVVGSTTTCTVPVRVGDTVSVTSTPGNGSVVDSVVGCPLMNSQLDIADCEPFIMSDEKTITATFRGPQTLTLNVGSVEGGQGMMFGWISPPYGPGTSFDCVGVVGSTTTCTVPVRIGDTVSVTSTPGNASVVDSVVGCPLMNSQLDIADCEPFIMSDEKTITATFRGPQTLSLTFSGDGSGQVAVAPAVLCASSQGACTALIRVGTQELTASASADSLFQAWTGACAGQGPLCSLSVSDDVATHAVFVLRNHPPVANAGGPYSGPRNQAVAFNGAASTDPEPDTLTYSWDFGDGSAAGTGVAPTHAYATAGTFTVTLTVNDGTVNSAPATSTVTITNQAPIANAGGPYSGVPNQATLFSGAASSDPDGDALTYSWDFGDGSPAGAGVAPTHAYATAGTFTVTLTVNDGTANSTAATATVTISNQAPVANAGGPYAGVRNQAITFSGAVSNEPDGDTLTYSWDFGDGSPAGSGVAPTHAYATTGTFTVTLTVNDGTVNSTAATATVTISNQAPTANAGGPYSGVRNQAVTFSGAASTDPDGDALTYSWDFGDGSPAESGVALTHAYTSTGTFTATLTVNDGTTNSTAATSTVTISNQAPAANAGGPYSGVRSQAITFNGTGSSDPDGDALAYSWDFGDGSPAGTGVAPSHAYAATGMFTVTLTVNDGTATSTPATATVTISNQAPTANAGGPYPGVRNQAIAFSGAASNDPDGDALTYSWDFGDGSPTGSGVAPTHAYASTGTFTVTLTANDGTVNSTAATATVTITNQAPTANAGGPYAGVRNQAVALSGAASNDPDGDTLTYSWDFGDGGTAGSGVAPTHAYASTGTFTVTLTVNDGTVNSTTATATVTISNQGPTANAGGPYAGTRLAAIGFIGAASTDPDGDALTYSWSFGDGGVATGPTPTHLYTATGTFTVTLTVNDGTTNSAPATSSVTITNVAPTVALTSPGSGAVFHAPASVTVSADAADADGGVAKVEFYAGAVKIGEALGAPYQILWPATVPGAYTLTAVVTDSSGVTVGSVPVNVLINAPPTVALTAPADNSQFASPASITLTASAADGDGTIAQVQFFRGATSLGVDSTAPYSVTWTGATVGSYQLTAVATDNRGAIVTSPPITVKVTATLAFTADSYVRASSSNSNFGTATELTAQHGSSNSNIRWTYVKFDLSTIPTITNARVRLFGRVSATTTTAINTAAYAVVDTSWTETGIKWSNKPATGTTALTTVAIVNNSTTARWYEFDVTAHLQAEKAAGRNVVTLAFKNPATSTPYVTFTSRQGTAANRPQVVVVP